MSSSSSSRYNCQCYCRCYYAMSTLCHLPAQLTHIHLIMVVFEGICTDPACTPPTMLPNLRVTSTYTSPLKFEALVSNVSVWRSAVDTHQTTTCSSDAWSQTTVTGKALKMHRRKYKVENYSREISDSHPSSLYLSVRVPIDLTQHDLSLMQQK